jgi:hemerythrin-like domain-containing protein
MHIKTSKTRREFLQVAGLAGFTGLAMTPIAGIAAAAKENEGDEEVSANEDLMREHGLLKRVLLVYGEAQRRLEANEDVRPESLHQAAQIIREFVEDYHEKLEEDYLFPRLIKAGQQLTLVKILIEQHQAGRRLTDVTLRLATLSAVKNSDERRQLADSLRQFIRMYNPHEAREDTVLFPAFKKVVSKHEYDALGEDFEKKEHQIFGGDGFDINLDKVAQIEKDFGLSDLAQFTPRI